MVVNKAHYARDEKAFLPHGSAVRIGPVTFYFHLPPQPGGAPLLVLSSDDESGGDATGGNGGGSGDESKGGHDDQSRGSSSAAAGPGRPRTDRGSMGNGKEKGSRTYSEMVYEAFASPELAELGRKEGLTSSDVTAWIIERYAPASSCLSD